MKHPEYKIENINIISLYNSTPKELIFYFKKNKKHLEESMPLRDSSFYEEKHWKDQIQKYIESFKNGESLRFVLKDRDKVIGTINFDQIIYGVFRSCYLGYSLDEEYQGKGIMTKSLQFSINYVINELKLNRIMANYIPQNYRSRKLLHKLGFEREGYARKYLMLNGEWKDHILTSFINDL